MAGKTPNAKVALRRDSMMLEGDAGRRVESRLAPPKYTERRRTRPGAGRKRSRASMLPRSHR
jgi:hypothetical protein